MVIDPNSINNSTSASARGKAATSERASASRDADAGQKSEAPSRGESVSLSETAHAMGKLEAAIAASPDVNQQRIEILKQRIESGQYQVNADSIAGKMLNQDLLS